MVNAFKSSMFPNARQTPLFAGSEPETTRCLPACGMVVWRCESGTGKDPDIEEKMKTRQYTKLVHEGEYVAEVDVQLIETDTGWSPYLSLEDAFRLDDVREALRRGDIRLASRQARLFTLTPVAV